MTDIATQSPRRRVSPQERWGAAAAPALLEKATAIPASVELATEPEADDDEPLPRKRTRRRFSAKDAGVVLCRAVEGREDAAAILGALQGLATAIGVEGAANATRVILSSSPQAIAEDIDEYRRAVGVLAPHLPPEFVYRASAPLYDLIDLLHAREVLLWSLARPDVNGWAEDDAAVREIAIQQACNITEAETKLSTLRDQRHDVEQALDMLANADVACCPICAQSLGKRERADVLETLRAQMSAVSTNETFYEHRLRQLGASIREDERDLPDFMREPPAESEPMTEDADDIFDGFPAPLTT